ncbi:hypothetical protein FNH13_03320 [Ornithinimicrobium ciconiae]|uniref:Cell wall-binding repeat-containing protein n=1 Tax=Ornithinimicrobium ciconiae TaxID=2594265 RepID=A0A516G7L3_9MICO|nr:cell wall-binding repeat-containing protein [Ornithinimicrobium ciconiae]QDO87485.1 hypothetical protein FNH13_03320 [Ornithinimicrobium ciconiae]
MSRTLALALAAAGSLSLLSPAALAAPNDPDSTAQDPAAVAAADDPVAAAAAGQYVATHVPADGNLGGPGGSADAALALLATGGHDDQVALLVDYLESQAVSYAGAGGPAAGKLALVAAATGADATDFGGVDLIAAIQGSIAADGSCGSWGFAFGNALCILGLERNGVDVPTSLLGSSYSFQDPETGAFGFFAGESFTPEADATGLMLSALSGVADVKDSSGSAVDRDAALSAAAARNYLVDAQTAEGYWQNYSPINATGLVAPALQTVGVPSDDAVAWLGGQQLADGGLPNVMDGGTSNLMATTQGLLPFTGQSYLSVGAGGTDTVDLVVHPDLVERIGGANRYETAAAASADAFEPGVDTVYVATGADFADALSGSALAGHLGAPVLLVKPDGVPAVTATELERLAPGKVVVLGGTAAVSDAVMAQVGTHAEGNVERVSGANRYATAAAVAARFTPGEHLYVATGAQYADALAASAAAGAAGEPVLLVTAHGVPNATAETIASIDPTRITVVGGTGAVPAEVVTELEQLAEVTRVAGTDRYATAAALSELRPQADGAVLATGQDYPDALTGAAYAAQGNVPVLLVKPDAVPAATRSELHRTAARELLVLGGTGAVSTHVTAVLEELNYAD